VTSACLSPLGPVHVDAREAGRVVATVLLAAGPTTSQAVERADAGLRRLGRAGLAEGDFVVSTPEELAPLIPADLRPGLAELLLVLAGDEPLATRMAHAYIALWQLPFRPSFPAPSKGRAHALARWLVGPLPRHQDSLVPQEKSMMQSVYRELDGHSQIVPAHDPLRERALHIQAQFREVVAAVERVIIGKRSVVERALTAMAARGHVLFVDVPGVGKTQLCKAIAAAIGVRFGRIQFTPDLLPMDLTGATVYEPHSKQLAFRSGPVFTNVLLADEINRATPKTQSALLEVMEERTVTVDGVTHPIGEPFQVLATMNPLDHEGTFALPAAQIDRFMVMLELGYPTPDDEVRVLDAHLAPDPVLASVDPVVSSDGFLEWQRAVPRVHVAQPVKQAAVAYVNGLRRDPSMAHAVSPRATLAWVRLSQARALFAGREFVTVEDLLETAADVLRHRMWLSPAEIRDRMAAVAANHPGSGR
jgi:MoxR-like ATPase